MNKFILMTVLALASLNNATAIGITLDRIQFTVGDDSIEVYHPFSRFHVDNEQFPFVNPNYSFDWLFANTAQSASLDGYWYMRGDELFSSATVAFTLIEPAIFSITGGIRQPEWLATSFTSLGAGVSLFETATSVLDIGSPKLPTLSGIFDPGQYVFKASGYAFGTESNSEVHLFLTPVPDAGSTLFLLTFAFCAVLCLKSLQPQTSN